MRNATALSFSEIQAILKEMFRNGCYQVSLGGGEPFLRKDLFLIIEQAKNLGMWVSVATNGEHLTGEQTDMLRELKIDFVTLSIDGATEETHRYIRRGGTLKKVLESAKLLSKAGISWAAHFTAMKPNLHEILLLPALLKKTGCSQLLLTVVKPAGKAIEHGGLILDNNELRIYKKAISTIPSSFPWLKMVLVQNIHYHRGFGCMAANSKCGIDSSGFMTPCDFLPERLRTGDVRQSGIAAIWRDHPIFRFVRMLKGNPLCSRCIHYLRCRGGCRARALHKTGDWNSPDSHCEIEREASN